MDPLSSLSAQITEQHKETQERLASIEKSQAVQSSQLGEHMRRTELLESSVDNHQNELVLLRQESKQRAQASDRLWKVAIAVAIAYLIKLLVG